MQMKVARLGWDSAGRSRASAFSLALSGLPLLCPTWGDSVGAVGESCGRFGPVIFGWMHDGHLLGFSELADTFGISKQNTRKHLAKRDFPLPVTRLACGPVWSARDVIQYMERRAKR